jgi:hypothetical protein
MRFRNANFQPPCQRPSNPIPTPYNPMALEQGQRGLDALAPFNAFMEESLLLHATTCGLLIFRGDQGSDLRRYAHLISIEGFAPHEAR